MILWFISICCYLFYYSCYLMIMAVVYSFIILISIFSLIYDSLKKIKIMEAKKAQAKIYYDIATIDEFSGLDFELFVAYNLLPNMGFKNIIKTQDSSDFGVDVVAELNNDRYAIQCKCYSDSVGIHAVQEVVGGCKYYDCNKCMVITNSHYTSAAKKLAYKNNVLLICREDIETVEININNNLENEGVLNERD